MIHLPGLILCAVVMPGGAGRTVARGAEKLTVDDLIAIAACTASCEP